MSLINRVREHTPTAKPKKKRSRKPSRQKMQPANEEITIEFAQTLKKCENAGTHLAILRGTSKPKNTNQRSNTATSIANRKAEATMNNKLFSMDIYQHVIDHFESIDIDQLDTFPASKEYRNVNAWMLILFAEYYDNLNS